MLLTDPQKAIYNLVASGGAFKNPYQPTLSEIVSSSDEVISEIPNILTVNMDEQDELEEALIALKGAANNFIAHTNRVSGVQRFFLGTIPDLHQILGVARARQQLKLQFGMTNQQALDSGLELFASLYYPQSNFTQIVSFNNTIITRLENAGEEGDPGNPPSIPPTPAPPNPQIPIVISRLNSFTAFLVNAPIATDAAYNTALQELYIASMMYELSTFGQPPTTTEHVVAEEIGTNTLLQLIAEQKSIIDNA